MKYSFLLLCLLGYTLLFAEEPSRTWTSKHGLTVQGAYKSFEDGTVIIKKPSGDLFKAKLDSLSSADVEYVTKISFSAPSTPSGPAIPGKTLTTPPAVTPPTPPAGDSKTVKVTFLLDPNPVEPSIKEVGVSPRVRLNDSIELNVAMAHRQDNEVSGDSTWVLESLDSVSGTIKAANDALPPLKTEGLFYFLSYSVENKGNGGFIVPAPVLQDSRNRKYYALSAIEKNMDSYIPSGMSSAEKEFLRPEFKRQFCSVYELPKDTTITKFEIFPLRMTRNPLYSSWIRSGKISGKSIDFGPETTPATNTSGTTTAKKADPVVEKPKVFMSCKQKTSKGTELTQRVQTRVLAYTVDLRLTKPQQKDMAIKAYFIATDPEGDGIIDVVDQQISLQQGKSFSTAVESKPVKERSSKNENTVFTKLKGVIIQLWADGEIIDTWVSNSQWDKQAKLPDLELKMRKAKTHDFMEEDWQDRDRRPKKRN
jgi:hypothetical protein